MFEEKVRKLLHRLSMTSENDVRTVRTIPGHVIRAISTFGLSPSTIESAPGQLATLDSQRVPRLEIAGGQHLMGTVVNGRTHEEFLAGCRQASPICQS